MTPTIDPGRHGCHSDLAPRTRLPAWSITTRCGAYAGRAFMDEEHILRRCDGCAYRFHIPRERGQRHGLVIADGEQEPNR
ncbi:MULTISPECIES: hypothetical protein [Halorhodospira]|uniref:hypothetical protein n=1 Tax=Halorhodospira TaxID=85108 RepID=UPI001EE80999|nr:MULTISPECIES: hypothetical protein [Halorhodospira]MCG5526886.1 hypothetical protein [Halorhodospira halophila]MCG5542777.1 hypothetical protein [Halorhodospira sp. 9628]